MSFGIPDDFKELVRSRTDLVGLVGETVQLQATRGGQDHIGLCPWHEDRRPSLHVYPERQSYRCWVCDQGGDCFSWVQDIERLSFPEAIEFLARRVGLEVPKERGRGPAQSERQGLFDVLAWAEEQFHRCLLSGDEARVARDYLASRGYTAETIAAFRLGFHPDSWTWLLERAQGRFTARQLLQVRLVAERNGGSGYYDYFKNRVLFPIQDERGRPVAFGGRVLPQDEGGSGGKYFNSPESELFRKSQLVYGFASARNSIRETNTAVVVEGYTDCIACHQSGLRNVVATLGTALTEQHVTRIRRFAPRIVLVYDGDDAGQRAAERAITRILAQEVDLRILTLPSGDDPADFIAREGVEALRGLTESAVEAVGYKFDRVVERLGTETLGAREQVRDEVLTFLAGCPGLSRTDREDSILGTLARRLMMDERRLRGRLTELTNRQRPRTTPELRVDAAPQEDNTPPSQAELEVLEVLLVRPELLTEIRQQIGPDDFESPLTRRLLECVLDLAETAGFDGGPSLLRALDEDAAAKRMTVALDDSARAKDIAPKLSAGEDNTLPTYVRDLLSSLTLRRNARQKELSKHHLSQSSSDLDSDTRDALRRLTRFQQERMRHPSTLK